MLLHPWVGPRTRCGVRLSGNTILFIQVYLTCGLGPTGENLKKLYEMELTVRSLGVPFAIAGDWNCAPEELASITWLRHIGATIMRPEEVQSTRANGGRMLDFVVASSSLADVIRVRPFAGPWQTHLALEMLVPWRPSSVQAIQWKRSKDLPPSSTQSVLTGPRQPSVLPAFTLDPSLPAWQATPARGWSSPLAAPFAMIGGPGQWSCSP